MAPAKGLVLFTIDYIDDWKKLSEIEYKAKKVDVAKIYIEKLDKLIRDESRMNTMKSVRQKQLNAIH